MKQESSLPRYQDNDESDVFILSGAEDLVPVLGAGGNRRLHRQNRARHHPPGVVVPALRRRVFARIERWAGTSTGLSRWRSTSRDDMTTLYGFVAGSRIANPADQRQVCSYLICRAWTTEAA